MPSSNLATWPEVIHLAHQVPHDALLDVGPGWGKAAVLLREYLNEKPVRIDAVEAWPPYIEGHRLSRLYDACYLGDACCDSWVSSTGGHKVDADVLLTGYDVVLMGDVIEHMAKPDALAFLARIPGRVVISTPVEFFDNGPGLPPTEAHVSHWGKDDWSRLEEARMVEACHESLGAWLVRLGPLDAR